MKIVGIDPSLTSTGVCVYCPEELENKFSTWTIKSKKTGPERLIEIRDAVRDCVRDADLVVLEGYAYARPNQAHQIGELGGVLRVMLHEEGIKWVEVAPAQLKKFATGKGNATKESVAAWVQKRWGVLFEGGNDETDAFVLANVGRAYRRVVNGLTTFQQEIINSLKGKGKKKKAG